MKINVLYVINKSKLNKKGLSSLICRLTYNGKRKNFSLGISINPSNWDSKNQLVLPNEANADICNTKLNLTTTQLNQAFLFLSVRSNDFTVDDIYKLFRGEKTSEDIGVVESYFLFCDNLKKLIGKELNQNTYDKYLVYGNHLKGFVKFKFKSKDVKLKLLKFSFIEQFSYYLKTELNFVQSTTNKVLQRFRRSIRYAISENYLDKDPFMMYKSKIEKKEVVYLNQDELKLLEAHKFEIPRIQKIKDMFIFCCYTGLAFKEMSNLKKADLVKEFDGNLWIHVYRGKTSKKYKVPLLSKAMELISKYNSEHSTYVFPSISNANFNAYLKEIADIVGIRKHLTHHIARKTFATTVLLYNDVPMEVVSELLGHSKIQTTQEHYGKIVQKKVGEHMFRISNLYPSE